MGLGPPPPLHDPLIGWVMVHYQLGVAGGRLQNGSVFSFLHRISRERYKISVENIQERKTAIRLKIRKIFV